MVKNVDRIELSSEQIDNLSMGEQKELRRQLRSQLYRKSFWEFFKRACEILEPSTSWQWNWHLEYLCNEMQVLQENIESGKEKQKDIIVNLPFRSGKSMLFSVLFPLWCWTRKPDTQFICLTYGEKLSISLAAKSMNLMETKWFKMYFPEIALQPNFKSKSEFMTTKGGKRFSSGTGGGVLGQGGHYIILDDPNHPKQITTVGMQEVIRHYNETIFSRLNDPKTGYRIVIQQRLHQNDLSGYLLENYPERYHHICIPATITDYVQPSNLVSSYVDGYFWKDRFGENELQDYEKQLGSFGFAGQLMQRPVTKSGAILKSEYFPVVDWQSEFNDLDWHLIIDPAFTSDIKKNDPSAVMICAIHNNHLIVRKVFQYWLEFPELLRKIDDLIGIYGDHRTSKVFIEPKAAGQSIVQELKRNSLINVHEITFMKGDKVNKVHAIAPQVEAGRVKLLEDSWNDNFIEELELFPVGKHDDQVDVLVYGVNELLLNEGNKNRSFSYRMYSIIQFILCASIFFV